MARKLKNGAQELFNDFKQFIDDIFKWIEEVLGIKPTKEFSNGELDWMATKKIGNLGGSILKESQIRKLRGFLKGKEINLIVEGDLRSVTKLFKPIGDFKKVEDLFYYMRIQDPPYVGMFHAETGQFFLTKEATEIVAFHEQMHFFHFEEVGKIAYQELNKLDKEMYVWKQILANRNRWTDAELKEALNYINRIRVKEYGLDPIKIK